MNILVAQGRTSICNHVVRAVIDAMDHDYGVGDPDRNPLWGPDTA